MHKPNHKPLIALGLALIAWGAIGLCLLLVCGCRVSFEIQPLRPIEAAPAKPRTIGRPEPLPNIPLDPNAKGYKYADK